MFRTLEGRAPKISLPPGNVDCHIHLFNSAKYDHQQGGPKPPPDALISHYEQVQKWLGIDRVVITQGNAYQFDNRCTLEALDHFGGTARAIVAIRPDISDEEINSMSVRGVCGARIMDILQGAMGLAGLLDVNARVYPFGWSLIVQFDGRNMAEHAPLLERIQGDYVIDHTGKFLEPVGVDSAAFKALLTLIDRGNCYVKLAGCYETSKSGYPYYEDVGALSKALINHAPDRIIWGSNFPHNMATSALNYPDDVHLLDLVNEWAGSEATRHKIFVENPARLYGFPTDVLTS
jgi:D-galactarolactone isomerase